jgi:Domain of unknown function (DUF4328)
MTPEGYEPLDGRAKWAQRALVAAVLIDAIAVVSGWFEYRLYQQDVITDDELDASDLRQGIVAVVQLAIFVWAVVAFIRWFHRAYRNLEPLGASRRFRKGWAIWGWFVPIWGLFRPKQIANDIWRASDPDAGSDQGAYEERSVPAIFQFWWAAYLISSFANNAALRISFRAETIDDFSDAAVATMIADGSSVIAGILAILVVRRSTERQAERARRLAQEEAGPSSAPGPAAGATSLP